MKSAALLIGRIFDDRGNRMSPSHARKGRVKYRYYLSSALLQGMAGGAGSVRRVPAADIEALVVRSVRQHLKRAKALMLALGSVAGTQNVDRILRLPGTTNLPNKKKIKAGRIACPTKLIRFNDISHLLAAFPPAAAATKSTLGQGKPPAIDIVDTLPISQRIKNLIRGVDDPEHPYESRSEAVYAGILAMVGGGGSDEQIEAVFLDPSYPISAHVLEKAQAPKYLARQIAQARKAATDPDVAKLNETYALVIVGDRAAVMRTLPEGIKFLAVSAFEQWHGNRFVQRRKKRVPLAKHWLMHPQRRQFEGITFAPRREVPGHFNLWRGFSVQPEPGDCTKFLAHLRDNVCCGDDALYGWVVGWFAQIFQHPEEKVGTALVLRGRQGTGKTKVGDVIGSLLGDHYALVSDPRYVTGRFNSHLVSCLLLHCDESFWAGDHAAEGKLKDLITGGHHFIEYKGKEPIRVRNFVRLLVTGNPDWMVPAGFEERRFAVLDVGEQHMKDHAYFAAIDEEMRGGGREALLHHLLHFDLGSVDLRSTPKTAALLDQKIASMTPEQGWWLDLLRSGVLPGDWEGVGEAPSEFLYNSYIVHAQRRAVHRRSIETTVGMFLRRVVRGLRGRKGVYALDSRRSNPRSKMGPIYVFPSLQECRTCFSEQLQTEIEWEAGEWLPARPEGEDYDEGGEPMTSGRGP
jgi:Family of unknown function (DUF5906)